MVCANCQKLQKTTQLATPAVKRKSDIYHGSPASSDGSKSSATLGATGISKSKLLNKSARNPYAAYSSSCTTCKAKVDQGHEYCHKCAYAENACAVCGKSQNKSTSKNGETTVQGQRFSAK